MNNMQHRILSLLVLLMTAATGAWAGIIIDVAGNFPTPYGTVACTTADEGKVLCTDGTIYPTVALATEAGKTAAAKIIVIDPINQVGLALALSDASANDWSEAIENASTYQPPVKFGGVWTLPNRYQWEKMIGDSYINLANGFTSVGGTNMVEGTYWSSTSDPGDGNNAFIFYGSHNGAPWLSSNKANRYNVRYCLFFNVEEPIAVDPVTDAASTWQFKMPGGNVEFSLVFAQATILDADGETVVRSYATLKDAFDAVQTGQTIQLDQDVTFSAQDDPVATNTTNGSAKFKLDFNGHIIDGLALGNNGCIWINNAGDEITFIDSSTDQPNQTGGLKGVINRGNVDDVKVTFEAGRYNFGDDNLTAALLNDQYSATNSVCQLAEYKWFVDIENAPDANGFRYYVDDMGFWVTVPAGESVTYYSDKVLKLADTPAGGKLYTITGVSGNTATAEELTVAAANTPLIVTNTDVNNEKTFLLQITGDTPNNPTPYTGFKGTLSDYTIPASTTGQSNYAFNGLEFVIVRTALSVAANKAWLEVPATTARNIQLVFADDDATAIGAASGSLADNGDVYDLSGRKLDKKPTRKGVYVKNGQKVIIK